jgi:hypothetical protein
MKYFLLSGVVLVTSSAYVILVDSSKSEGHVFDYSFLGEWEPKSVCACALVCICMNVCVRVCMCTPKSGGHVLEYSLLGDDSLLGG